MSNIDVTIELNGRTVTDRVPPDQSLRAFLRRHGMFSVKYGSPSGETGAGAVLVDGRLTSSDILLA
ncbi:MAG: xanthine dehydrogenase, partial [Actinomycetota bacterium]